MNLNLTTTGLVKKSSPTKALYNHGPKKNSGDDLFRKIRGFLVVGKFLGIIPCTGVFQGDLNKLKFRWRSLGTLVNVVVIIMLGLSSAVSFVGMCQSAKHSPTELAFAGSGCLFYTVGTYIYIYFLRNANEFINLFKDWSNLRMHFTLEDKKLSKEVGIVTGLLFTSAVLENALLQMIQFPVFEGKNSADWFFFTYFLRADSNWSKYFSYHTFLSIFIFIANKLALYSWNYADFLIAVFSRALYIKFKLLHKVASETTENIGFIQPVGTLGHSESELVWTYLVRDHTTLCNLLARFESFLSPLVFSSYGTNIFYTCLQLLQGLTPSEEDEAENIHINRRIYKVYAVWSFVHLIVRLYLVSICAANINVHAHLISRCLRRCPVVYYNTEVQRTDRRVCMGPEIGLTGLGAFTVTKPFILSIIGVVFTFEIILLQSIQPVCPPPINCIIPENY